MLSVDDRVVIVQALNSVWDRIAMDVLKEQGETMTGEEVGHLVADFLTDEDDVAGMVFQDLDRLEKDSVLATAFPDSIYGW